MDRENWIFISSFSHSSHRNLIDSGYGHLGSIQILGSVPHLSPLYDSADLLITPPCSVTVTEAMVKRLPMAILDPVSGCEARNLAFLLPRGGVISAHNVNALCDACADLLYDQNALSLMADSLRLMAPEPAVETIYRTMTMLKS